MKEIRTKAQLWIVPEASVSLSMMVEPRSAVSSMGPAVIMRSSLDQLISELFAEGLNLVR